jgi:hypothetical protein
MKGGAISKEQIEEAADTIVKICGNTSVLINQIVPSNFVEYWSMLVPLMKDQYQAGAPELKQQLLDTVVMRDNIGEAMWYIYTAILLISITQYNIMKRGCTGDLATMQASHEKYLEQEATVKAKTEKAESTIYTY